MNSINIKLFNHLICRFSNIKENQFDLTSEEIITINNCDKNVIVKFE